MIKSVPVGPYKLWADEESPTGIKFLQNGLNYEVHIRRELEKFVPTSVGFLDAGANVGLHTMSAKTIRPDLPIVAVEMAQANIELLARNIFENGLTNVTLIPVALSNKPGIVGANRDATNPCCNLSNPGPDFERLMPALPLDFYNLPPIDLVKIDIEGFEYAAWQGAKKLFAMRPRIIFEFCPEVIGRSNVTPLEQLEWLIAQGYRLTALEYEPGFRKECSSAREVIDHLAATSKWITDILAEPVP